MQQEVWPWGSRVGTWSAGGGVTALELDGLPTPGTPLQRLHGSIASK